MEHITTLNIEGRELAVSKDDERHVVRVTGLLFSRRGSWLPNMEDNIVRTLRRLDLPVALDGAKYPNEDAAEFRLLGHVAAILVNRVLRKRVKQDSACQILLEEMKRVRRQHFLAQDVGLYRPDKVLHDSHRHWINLYREAVRAVYREVEHPYKWLAEEQLNGREIGVNDPCGNYFYHPDPVEPTAEDLDWLQGRLDEVTSRLAAWREKVDGR